MANGQLQEIKRPDSINLNVIEKLAKIVSGIRLRLCAASFVVLALALTGCSRTISFEEEVEISPGEVIVIKRYEKHKRASEAFKPGWRFEQSTLRIPFQGVPDWEADLRPMLLIRNQNGAIVLIARTVLGGCTQYRGFIFGDGKWYGTAMEQQYIDRDANLLIAGTDEFESKVTKVSLSEKMKKNKRAGLDDSVRRIVRNLPC